MAALGHGYISFCFAFDLLSIDLKLISIYFSFNFISIYLLFNFFLFQFILSLFQCSFDLIRFNLILSTLINVFVYFFLY